MEEGDFLVLTDMQKKAPRCYAMVYIIRQQGKGALQHTAELPLLFYIP